MTGILQKHGSMKDYFEINTSKTNLLIHQLYSMIDNVCLVTLYSQFGHQGQDWLGWFLRETIGKYNFDAYSYTM